MAKCSSQARKQRRGSTLASLGALAVSGALASAACGDTDGKALYRPGPGASGSAGNMGAAGTGGTSGSGAGGSGGTTEPRDAGLDSSADATSPGGSCVVASLAAYCAVETCPANYAEARSLLPSQGLGVAQLRFLLQQACSAPDGSPRLAVSGDFRSFSKSYIFDATSGQLVSVFIYDDLGGCAGPNPMFIGSERGFYGDELPACGFRYDDYDVPPACSLDAGSSDAGSFIDAGADAGGGWYECILAP
jgi:hypothetical protein